MASELRVNNIKNRSGLGTVTFSDEGLIITGITSLNIGNTNLNTTGIITATSFSGDGSQLSGLSKVLTIGVRTGSAVTFSITGSSFNVSGRSGNISIGV
jgi:hypothetical protein